MISERPSVRTRTTRFSCLISLIVLFRANSRASPVYVASANQRRSFTALDTETSTLKHSSKKEKICGCLRKTVYRGKDRKQTKQMTKVSLLSGCICPDSLFKVGDAVCVDSQLHDFLCLCAAVLDNAHPGVITCKLGRDALHSDLTFLAGFCLQTPLKLSASHPH